MVNRLKAFAALAIAALSTVGCAHGPGRYNITVQLDDAMRQRLSELTDRNIEVDLLAVNNVENDRWENASVNRYWQPGDPLKGSVPTKVMIFNPKAVQAAAATRPSSSTQSAAAAATQQSAISQTLSAKDPIWDKWYANKNDKSVYHLYVLALLPGVFEDAPGDRDPRRQILPLNVEMWPNGTKDILLKVQTTGIVTVTTPKPKKR
jgi:hypothetical protein